MCVNAAGDEHQQNILSGHDKPNSSQPSRRHHKQGKYTLLITGASSSSSDDNVCHRIFM